MRNLKKQIPNPESAARMRNTGWVMGHWPKILVISSLAIWIAGCAWQPAEREKATLQAGYGSLEARQYEQAIAQADAYLARVPHGRGSAEALYLKGRGYEGRVAHSQAEAKANLEAARKAYIAALWLNPPRKLDGIIRASLANVAYFQNDYRTAMAQWATAYDMLEDRAVQAWALYRIGICQQRLGEFDRADRTFEQVQDRFGGSIPAQRARERHGMRGFYLQVATFSSPSDTNRAVEGLRSQGLKTVCVRAPNGYQKVRIGPLASYQQALGLKSRFSREYPDAMVIP